MEMHVGLDAKLEFLEFDTARISGARSGLIFDYTASSREFTPHKVMTEVFYIGLGDQFDDDRRLVRQSE